MSSDMRNDKDILRCSTSFLKQFNSMYHRFNFLDNNMLIFLFQSQCMSFYWSELWYNDSKYIGDLKALAVNYHKAIKRILGLRTWDNNHDACERSGLPISKHFIYRKMLLFLFSLINSKSPCLYNLKLYFKYDSCLVKNIEKISTECYNVDRVLDNNLQALLSRINFVQRNEERTSYVPVVAQHISV